MFPEDYKVEALYNDEVQSLENQMMDSYQNYKRQSGNQGWNKKYIVVGMIREVESGEIWRT